MNLNEWRDAVHENSMARGWYDTPVTFESVIALCHSELSEALEEYRNNADIMKTRTTEDGKPEGVAIEMADCIMRILDWFGYNGIDVEMVMGMKYSYNKTRPYRHGGKVF